MTTSPFQPGFGSYPPALTGRQDALSEFGARLDEGRPLNYLVRGHRGMGKTVLLSALEDEATDRGWVVLTETAHPGFVDHLVDTATVRAMAHLQGKPVDRILTGGSIASLGGITTSVTRRNEEKPSIYTRLSDLLDAALDLNPSGGVLLTVDEIEANSLRDTSILGGAVQRFARERRPLFLVAAGLPHNLDVLLNYPNTTFLRRAEQIDVGPLEWDEARMALYEPIADGGRKIAIEDLDRLAMGTKGYPFLTQVLGDSAWRASPDSPTISSDDVSQALENGIDRMGKMVHRPALATLSNQQRDYLMAVADAKGAAVTTDIATRLGITIQAASNVRASLETHGLVYQPQRGAVALAVPYLAEFLDRHGAFPPPPPVASLGTFGPSDTANIAKLGHPRGLTTGPADSQPGPARTSPPDVPELGTDPGLN